MCECKQEERIRQLELHKVSTDKDITSLIEKLANLTSWVKALVIALIPCILTAFGWLIVQVFKH